MVRGRPERGQAHTAVLCSAGLDSAVLLAAEGQHATVVPIYVSVGFAWEQKERAWLDRLLTDPRLESVCAPVVALSLDMRDVYPSSHWARTGDTPAYDTPDEDVYIFGRNVVLLTKAAVYCAHHAISRVAIGPLAGNPFPDATPEFFTAFGHGLSIGLGRPLEITAPFRELHKEDVIRLGVDLGVPFELTLSCMRPHAAEHCGTCSKCRERQEAFTAAGVADPSVYERRWDAGS